MRQDLKPRFLTVLTTAKKLNTGVADMLVGKCRSEATEELA